jgi:hypothetical protein
MTNQQPRTMLTPPYNRSFFEAQAVESLTSAREIVPELLKVLEPRSVVDVGCGVGTWLSVFAASGVTEILGIDGDYVERDMLLIPTEAFIPHDLATPFQCSRRFDLVLSLETAEHLPPASAATFVSTLTALGDVVLFSAAVPGQAWTLNVHLNEQWPDYWEEIFQRFEFRPVDTIRRRVWNNPRVCWWYAQNMILFVKAEKQDNLQQLVNSDSSASIPLSVVHPRMLGQYADFDTMSLTRQWWMIKRLAAALTRKLAFKMLNRTR